MLNVLSRRYFKDILFFIFVTFYLGRIAEDSTIITGRLLNMSIKNHKLRIQKFRLYNAT